MESLRSVWNPMPVVRLLLPFMAGICICIGIDHWLGLFIPVLLFAVSVLIHINLLRKTASVYRMRYVSGIAISLAMLSAGYVVTYYHTDRLDPHHISHIGNVSSTYIGTVAEPAVVKDKTVNALIDVSTVSSSGVAEHKNGKIMASLVKTDKAESLRYGDQVTFRGVVRDYDGPKNPDQFDYKKYQSLHHIYQHIYLSPDEWRVTASGQGSKLLAKTYQVRAYFLTLIRRVVSGPNELAVATAIMLGYRDYVTDDVTQAYAGSGVLHVLSVSGLHVAVLYFVLNLLLGWMDKNRRLQILKGASVIIIMLFYAGLTGLSPPVLRSVWMFSLIVIAKLLDRDVSMYNVLAVSCLILLLYDPYYIADVGFQLSYIAVAGIVYIYPLLFALIEDTDILKKQIRGLTFALNWISRWSWGLICVSIAAQIATFPISLFYFHTFPNYFLLSNLLVIPLSNFVLISGMLLFVVGWSERLVTYVGWIFDHLLIALNKVVFGIDVLPYALSKGIVIGAFEMVMLYIVLAMIFWYLADRRAKVLIAGLCLMLILCSAFSIHHISDQGKRELVVYDIKGMKAISIIDHGTVYYDFDSALIGNEMLMRYNIRDHWYASGVSREMPIDSMHGIYHLPFGKMYVIGGKRILLIDKVIGSGADEKLKADVVILSASSITDMKDVTEHIDFKQLVFDTSNKPWRTEKWKEQCDVPGIRYYDCKDKAFVMTL